MGKSLRGYGAALLWIGLCTIAPQTASAFQEPAKDWKQWGGPNLDFTVADAGLADRWPEGGPRELWSRPLGDGNSMIHVEGDVLYTMYREWTGKESLSENETVIAMSAADGETLWEHTYAAKVVTLFPDGFVGGWQSGEGPHASALIRGDKIFTMGFTGKAHALNKTTGKVVWSRDLMEEFGASALMFGLSASPLEYDGAIIYLAGGPDCGLIAFEPEDGSIRWQSQPYLTNHANPIVVNVGGQDQIVFHTADAVVGVSAKNGEHRWSFPHQNQFKYHTFSPIPLDDNHLLISSWGEGGTQLIKLDREGEKTEALLVWEAKGQNFYHSTVLRIGDFLYGGDDRFFVGFNWRTGEVGFRERIINGNLIGVGDRALLLDEFGDLSLIRLSPEGMKKDAEFSLDGNRTWAAPTLIGTTLYIRDRKTIRALDLGASR